MGNMSKWMLGAAIVAGGLGLGATTAQAAEFGIYARGPVAYVPPCPGDGYSWQAGYMSGGYWTPGRWAFMGGGYRGHVAYFDRDHDRRFNREGDRDRDRGRNFDRHASRGHDRDGDRFRR
jgi:hypothetical protein